MTDAFALQLHWSFGMCLNVILSLFLRQSESRSERDMLKNKGCVLWEEVNCSKRQWEKEKKNGKLGKLLSLSVWEYHPEQQKKRKPNSQQMGFCSMERC